MKPTDTKRPTDAEVVRLLRLAALNTARAARSARGNATTGALYSEAAELRVAADALEAASAEPFAAKVERGAVAIARRHYNSRTESTDEISADIAERYLSDAAAVLRAAGVEG